MDVLVIITYVFLLAFNLKEISSFITRLPACKYSANYTKRLEGKYFNGIVNITVPNVSRRKCSLYCTVRDSCVFFNHKTDGTMCELLASHIGTLEDKPGWDFVSTNYTEWKFRGPMCRFLRPLCDFDKYCIDGCEAPGYKCKKLVNVAKGKVITVSPKAPDIDAVIDGDIRTFWQAADGEKTTWIFIDLATEYEIYFITIVSWRHSLGRLRRITIQIGNNGKPGSNPICVDNVNQNGIFRMNHFCKYGIMSGRYVWITKSPSSPRLALGEIMLYTL